jgi:hypothetical protein
MIQRVLASLRPADNPFQLRKVFDIRRQVQAEAVAVLDDFPRNAEQLQAIQRHFIQRRLGAFDDLFQACFQLETFTPSFCPNGRALPNSSVKASAPSLS